MEYHSYFGLSTFSLWYKKNETEIKRVDILLNKTREEVAKDYLTRNEHTIEFQRLIDKIDKLDAKIDKLITINMAIGQIVGQQPVQSKVGPVTGQAYAQQIAGGIPFEQVVAPGLQFSPEAPMGLTQAQLDLISAGEAPVMPVAPTIGEPVAPSIPTMPFAPVGTPMPTLPFIQRKF